MDATYTINIDLNQRRTLSDDKFTFFAPWLFKELEQYIKERIIEIESFQKKHPNNNHQGEDFKSLKKFDAIVVEGLRGSGKTTFLEMISKFARELNLPVKVVDLIDTNEILSRKNIILVLLKRLEEIVEEKEYILNYYDENYHVNLKEIKADLIKIRDTIESHLFGEHFSDIDRAEYFQELAESLRLAENIHYLSKKICDLLKVKSIIVPIDDLDMDFTFYEKVLSDIRLYMTTPYIIPVVAFDVNQIYLLLKKKYYQVFGLSLLDEPKIRKNPEFSFLRKLTSEFIQKLFPPSRKIVIPDMLDYYKYIMKNKQNIKVFFKFRNSRLNESFFPNNEIKLSFQELTRAFMNVVYGYDGKDIDNPEDYHVVNYLKGKTLRSIIDDYKSFLKGIKEKRGEDNDYIYFLFSSEELKKRFRPYNKEIFSNKYDATKWFWEKYIELVHNRENLGKSYLVLDEIEKTLIINPDDSVSEIRKEKTYVRLFLQDFFMSEINIGFLKEKGGKDGKREIIISKIIDVSGYFELALRTVFPAILFENLVNTNQIDIGSFPIESLISFYRDDNRYSLEESLQNISSWTYFYGIDNENFLAKEINNRETSLYRNKHKKFYVEVYDLYTGDIKFLLSPFKYMYYLLLRLKKEGLKIPTIDSSLGVVSLIEFSRNLAQNIALIFAKKGNDDLPCDEELKDIDEKHKKYARYHGNLQFMSLIISVSLYNLLLNTINNLKYLSPEEMYSQINSDWKDKTLSQFLIQRNLYKNLLGGRQPLCLYKLTSNLFIDLLNKILTIKYTAGKSIRLHPIDKLLDFILKEIIDTKSVKYNEFLYSNYIYPLLRNDLQLLDTKNKDLIKYRKINLILRIYFKDESKMQQRNKNLFIYLIKLLKEKKEVQKDITDTSLNLLFNLRLYEELEKNSKEEFLYLLDSLFRGLLRDFYLYEVLKEREEGGSETILGKLKNENLKPYLKFFLEIFPFKDKRDKYFNQNLNNNNELPTIKELYKIFIQNDMVFEGNKKENLIIDYANQVYNGNYLEFIKTILNVFMDTNLEPKYKCKYFSCDSEGVIIRADIALDFVNFVIKKIQEEYKNKQK